jgi:hypothetical protein
LVRAGCVARLCEDFGHHIHSSFENEPRRMLMRTAILDEGIVVRIRNIEEVTGAGKVAGGAWGGGSWMLLVN